MVNGLFKLVFMIKYEMYIQQIFLNEVRLGYKFDYNDIYNDKLCYIFLKFKVVLMSIGCSIVRCMGRVIWFVGRCVGVIGCFVVIVVVF